MSIVGELQRFLYWLYMEADLNDESDRMKAVSIAEDLENELDLCDEEE